MAQKYVSYIFPYVLTKFEPVNRINMRKIILPAFLALVLTSCSSDSGSFGGGDFKQVLIAGQEGQAGVTYNDNIESIAFTQIRQEGDSTFYEAKLDLDQNNSIDLSFTLVKWSDIQVLTLKGRNGVEIPFSGGEFEILENEALIPGINLLQEGTQINSLVKDYTTAVDGFITYTRGNSVNVSANHSIWTKAAYLPFLIPSTNKEGWVSIDIISNTGVQIEAIGIDMIAIRNQ